MDFQDLTHRLLWRNSCFLTSKSHLCGANDVLLERYIWVVKLVC